MGEKLINRIIEIMRDYYGVILSVSTVKKVWSSHPELNSYKEQGFCTDFREELINDLCQFLNLPEFPIHGDTEEYKSKFKTDFISRAKEFKITVNWV